MTVTFGGAPAYYDSGYYNGGYCNPGDGYYYYHRRFYYRPTIIAVTTKATITADITGGTGTTMINRRTAKTIS